MARAVLCTDRDRPDRRLQRLVMRPFVLPLLESAEDVTRDRRSFLSSYLGRNPVGYGRTSPSGQIPALDIDSSRPHIA